MSASFAPRQSPLGDWVWAMTCAHGTVTSDEIVRTFSVDLILGCYLYWAEDLASDVSEALVVLVAMRTLLGRLAELRFDCACGLQPFRLAELPDGAPEGRPS